MTARDPFGNVATGYAGTVHFTSTDATATLPASYTFTTTDKGIHTFSVTFATPGTQSLSVTDAAGLTTTQSFLAVTPAAPIGLAAAAASSSRINLSWSPSAGATGYSIERSSGSSGWAQIGTTAAGVTTYADTGLAAGTAYSYRVRATGGGLNSAYSNTATATTTAATIDTIWSNSVTPQPDSYSYGSYELGVKFRSDAAGTVTGVRFYKESWMGGYTHVGHLCRRSSGALLGSVTFTGRDRLRVGAGELLGTDHHRGQHGLHRVVLDWGWLLRHQQQLLLHRPG